MRVIITGATSGIGRALAIEFLNHDFRVGVTGRRRERLEELKSLYADRVEVLEQDLRLRDQIEPGLDDLARRLGGVDIVVANAGTSRRDSELPLAKEFEVIEVNIAGFVATINWALRRFKQQGEGRIVGVSSVAAFWGNKLNPMYNATKAFEMNYLRGLHAHLYGTGISVTDVRPGFVATEMTAGNPQMIAVASPEKAAKQIFRAIMKRRKVVYITKRWRFIAAIMRMTPDFIYRRLAELRKQSDQ